MVMLGLLKPRTASLSSGQLSHVRMAHADAARRFCALELVRLQVGWKKGSINTKADLAEGDHRSESRDRLQQVFTASLRAHLHAVPHAAEPASVQGQADNGDVDGDCTPHSATSKAQCVIACRTSVREAKSSRTERWQTKRHFPAHGMQAPQRQPVFFFSAAQLLAHQRCLGEVRTSEAPPVMGDMKCSTAVSRPETPRKMMNSDDPMIPPCSSRIVTWRARARARPPSLRVSQGMRERKKEGT